MEKQQITRWFLGANSGNGFSSLYEGFCRGDGDFLRVIKGGPGCGKSTFMRRIGEAAEARGLEVEYILCSGDPDSLDGVYIPALRLGYADGTAPHIMDPECFGASCLKFMATFGVLSNSDDPGPQELTYEEMRAAIEIAEFRGFTSCAHAEGRTGINVAVRAGVTSIEHGVFMDEETADLMVERGTFLVPTLITMKRMLDMMRPGDFPAHIEDKIRRCAAIHAKTINMAYRKGVKIAFGTDVGAPYLPHGSQAEEFECMVHDAGMKPEHALQAATRVSAETLHWADRLGTITPGKLADIIAVKGDPIKDISVMRDVGFVMKDGAVCKNEFAEVSAK